MFNLMSTLWRAWQAGEIIRSPEKWKSGGELTNQVTIIVAALFALIIYFSPESVVFLSDDVGKLLVAAIVSVLGLINIIIGRITTRKEVGLNVLVENTKEVESIPEAHERRGSDK